MDGRACGWTDSAGYELKAKVGSLLDDFGDDVRSSKLGDFDQLVVGERVIFDGAGASGTAVIGILKEIFDNDDDEYAHVDETDESETNLFKEVTSCSGYAEYSYKSIPLTALKAYHGNYLRECIKRTRCHSVPTFLNSAVFDKIVCEKIEEEWRPLALGVLDKILTVVKECLKQLVDDNCPSTLGDLKMWFHGRLADTIDRMYCRTRELLETIVDSECTPYTNDVGIFENVNNYRNKTLLESIKKAVGRDDKVSFETIRIYFEANSHLDCEEHMARELQTILAAYGEGAANCFANFVPKMILSQMFKKDPCREPSSDGFSG